MNGFPALKLTFFILFPYRTEYLHVWSGTIVADWRTPPFQTISTVKPPLARKPLTSPSAHSEGKAGSRWISPACDWRSISAIPAVPPKFPSIWNGGWVSKRLSCVDLESKALTLAPASSPSLNRA